MERVFRVWGDLPALVVSDRGPRLVRQKERGYNIKSINSWSSARHPGIRALPQLELGSTLLASNLRRHFTGCPVLQGVVHWLTGFTGMNLDLKPHCGIMIPISYVGEVKDVWDENSAAKPPPKTNCEASNDTGDQLGMRGTLQVAPKAAPSSSRTIA